MTMPEPRYASALAALEFLSDRYYHTVESDGEDNALRIQVIQEALEDATAELLRLQSLVMVYEPVYNGLVRLGEPVMAKLLGDSPCEHAPLTWTDGGWRCDVCGAVPVEIAS